MRTGLLLFCLFVTLCSVAQSQPQWSPEVRSKREIQWMQDSLGVSQEQVTRIQPISLTYQQDMDKAGHEPHKDKKQTALGKKKDAALKKILDHGQYEHYNKREQLIRQRAKIIYKGHQPL